MVKEATGYDRAIVNYYLASMGPHVQQKVRLLHRCGLAIKQHVWQMRNANAHEAMMQGLQFIHQYPKLCNMKRSLGFDKNHYYDVVEPALMLVAQDIDFVNFEHRLWEYNHNPHFYERVTFFVDTFPVWVANPVSRGLSRLVWQKKYGGPVLKGNLGVGNSGLPVLWEKSLSITGAHPI